MLNTQKHKQTQTFLIKFTNFEFVNTKLFDW